jgi:hypothetical protein
MTMTNANNDDARAVDLLLKRAGISPTEKDRDWLVGAYPLLRQVTDELRVPETRYAEIVLTYPPEFRG